MDRARTIAFLGVLSGLYGAVTVPRLAAQEPQASDPGRYHEPHAMAKRERIIRQAEAEPLPLSRQQRRHAARRARKEGNCDG